MPGTPVFYYGDEIGMGDNVFLGDRDGVRTPMQWSFDRNGGFSRADPARLYLPPIMDPVYGFEAVNVEAQARSPSSLLNWVKRLIAARRSRRAFGRGTLRFLYPANRKVIAYLREFRDETVLCVANLSRSPQAVELDLSDMARPSPIELLGRSVFPSIGELPYLLTLQGYSFFWFDLTTTHAEAASLRSTPPEFLTLVMPHGWPDLFRQHNLPQLESDVLPAFLLRQRWYGAKDQRIRRAPFWRAARSLGSPKTVRPRKCFGECRRGAARAGRAAPIPAPVGYGVVFRRDRAAAGVDAHHNRRVAPIPPRGSAGRRIFAGRVLARDHGCDPTEATIRLEGGEIRCRKAPTFDEVRAAGSADGSAQRGGAVQQLGDLR